MPEEFYSLPLFGGSFPEKTLLTKDGVLLLKRMLCVLNHYFPHITYSPVLVHLLCLNLHFLSEAECLASIFVLIRKKEKLVQKFVNQKTTPISIICTSFSSVNQFAVCLHRLCILNLSKKELKVVLNCEIDEKDYATKWVSTMFESLPIQFRLHLLLLWANEGVSVLLRVGIALFCIAMGDVDEKENEKDIVVCVLDSVLSSMNESKWDGVLEVAISSCFLSFSFFLFFLESFCNIQLVSARWENT